MFQRKVLLSFVGLFLGCGTSTPTAPSLPKDAGEAISEAHGMILDASYGGRPLTGVKDLPAYEGEFPKAVAAIKSGDVKVIWGKSIKDNSPSPEIIAYEKAAESGEGWAIKDNGKLEKVSSSELPRGN